MGRGFIRGIIADVVVIALVSGITLSPLFL